MKLLKLILAVSLLITPVLATNAQTPTQDSNNNTTTTLPILPKPELLPGPTDPTGQSNPKDTLNYVTERLIPQASARFVTIIAVLSMIGIIFAGVKYYTAFGDDTKAESGKNIAIYSIIGLVVALMSLAIVSIIAGLAQFFQ